MMKKLIGAGVALVTPFDAKLQVDFQGLQKLLKLVTQSDVNYLVVHGTTGEAATTTPEEKKIILSFIHAHNPNQLPIVCGIGGNNTHEVIKTIENTDFKGIDAVLSVSPYYNKPSQEGIYQHYKAIAAMCPVPLLLYNVPSRTGSNINAMTTLRLSECNNIVGIKESSGDLLQCIDIAKNKAHDFLLISGDDMLTVPMITMGGAGVISTIGNIFPKRVAQMVNCALQGNYQAAREYAFSLLKPAQMISQAGNPVGTKQLLKLLTLCQNYVRLPLTAAAEELDPEVLAAINENAIK
jgi:4-hydroxy-tetrahydrodipicolinate synthase